MINKYKIPKEKLRKCYLEILREYTPVIDPLFYGVFFIKHIDNFVSEEIDEERENWLNLAKGRGLPTIKEKEQELYDNDLWTKEEDEEIKRLQDDISILRQTKGKLFLKKETDEISEEIKQEEKKLEELLVNKFELVAMTAEDYSLKKVNEYYLKTTSYKDKELKVPLFTEEEFEELPEEEVKRLTRLFNDMNAKFSPLNIKRISLSSFFMNQLILCKESPFNFYGKAVVNLTFHKTELFYWGRYYSNLLSEIKGQPTDEEMDNPDELESVWNSQKSAEKLIEQNNTTTRGEAVGTSIVGATSEDLTRMGLQDSPERQGGISLEAQAHKKGGKLEMDDFIKLHGA